VITVCVAQYSPLNSRQFTTSNCFAAYDFIRIAAEKNFFAVHTVKRRAENKDSQIRVAGLLSSQVFVPVRHVTCRSWRT